MFYIGDKKLRRCFLGDDPIGKVYLGNDLLYQHVSRLPAGYTEVEYISNPNGAYLRNFGLNIPFWGKRIELEVLLPNTSLSGSFLGLNSNNQKNGRKCYNYITYDSSKNNVIYYQKSASGGTVESHIIIPASTSVMKIILDVPKSIFEVNGTSGKLAYYYNDDYAGAGVDLYGRLAVTVSVNYGTQYENSNNFNFKLYSLNVYKSTSTETTEKTLELVPAINPNGLVGVYDLIANEFYQCPDTSRVFVAGPIV